MAYQLLKYALGGEYKEPRFFRDCQTPKKSYDAVIIGGGGHGLAAAYYLAKDHGITNVAVLEKGYIGGGNTGRNTTIVRSNYLTPDGVNFYDASVKLFEGLSTELDINLFYSNRGHFTLAHSESAMRTMRWRAEVNKHVGVKSRVVGTDEIAQACPQMDLSCSGKAPIQGALYHEPGSIARHDAVAWGYARGADSMGVEIFQSTEVQGIDIQNGQVQGVQTSRGYMKPWLDTILVSGSLHVYVSQSSRGELVMGSSLDPYEFHSTRSTFDFVEGLTSHIVDMFPFLSNVKVVRQWAGMADITPDFAPIMGMTPIKGFYLDAGWGTWGFKATPISGKTMAHTLANDKPHDLIHSFRLSRFEDYELTGDKGAASVGH